MITPGIMRRLLSDLRDRLNDAERDARQSSKIAQNSYGAGYDRGFADAIQEILNSITGETDVRQQNQPR